MEKHEFYVTLALWELNHNRMQWTLHIHPIDSHIFDEHSVYFASPGDAASHIRMMRELGAKLHIRRDTSVTNVFDKQWTDFKTWCAIKK